MAAVAVVRSLPVMRSTDDWEFPTTDDHDSSLTNLRLTLLNRGQSDGVTRRKRTGSSRSRYSWRWSWKQVLAKPFQNQTWTRGGSLRVQGNRKKRKSSYGVQTVTKNPVEARKKMDELYRIWLFDADDSSEESSDDEYSEQDRRRSCSPRIFASDTSSSDDDTDCEEGEKENNVSQYVKEGPSRIRENTVPEDERIIEERLDLDRLSESQVLDTNHFSSQNNLIPTQQEGTTNHVVDFNNPGTNAIYRNGLKQTQSMKKCKVIEKNTANSEQKLPAVSQCTTKHNKEIIDCQGSNMNSNDLPHITQEGSSEDQEQCDEVEPGVMTDHAQGMTNNYPDDHVISATQIFDHDILQRVEDLCAQCGSDKIYERKQVGSFQLENGIQCDNTKELLHESVEIKSSGRISFHLDTPHGASYLKKTIEKTTKDVFPDYPSSYPKTGIQRQMSSQNETQTSQLQCEFKRFGCQFLDTTMATQLEQHMQLSLNDHLKLVSKIAQDEKEQLQNQQLEQQKQNLLIQQLTDTVNNLEKLLKEQNNANQGQEKSLHSLKDQIKDQRKQSQRFEREVSNQLQSLSQSPLSSCPIEPCEAEFVWPIKGFRKRLRRIQDGEIDDPLISEPFYTGTYGYKLSVWVYLNGRGKTLGEWVSVYARVMPSDHDQILSWPVKPMYTFTLLDQSEGEKDHIVRRRKVNDIKRDGGKHHGIHRPEGGERSVIVGFDDFIAHSQLEKRKYLVDDCVYLKVKANLTY